MSDGFDLRSELSRGLRGAAGVARFIRLFAARYASPVAAGDGCTEEELLAAEARLGLPLPAPLRAVYALIGRRTDLTRTQDRLLSPDQVDVDDSGEVLVFRVENQCVAEWGVPLPAVTEPDPPVVFRPDAADRAGRTWRPFLDRVSAACVEMVLSEWMLSGGELTDDRELDGATVAALEERFHRLPIPDHPSWAQPGDGPTRWFEGYGAILREDPGTWLWVRAPSADGLSAVRRALPGQWRTDEG
ncbi:SMI1/KNR4 family protein [Pseudonocardia humida]|uniref:SMI1/KNR4 family protein n=1 Tax=Pseudonocardia humida TaxID=2800819 RepID=A0ABT1A2B1_9PSEU|nr:SMI1/KNR4 family protein [Pseudonocardia humida]MCO1657146.1 SMI1/KNR4 family protein [Pseudonocardia humida]